MLSLLPTLRLIKGDCFWDAQSYCRVADCWILQIRRFRSTSTLMRVSPKTGKPSAYFRERETSPHMSGWCNPTDECRCHRTVIAITGQKNHVGCAYLLDNRYAPMPS